MRALLGLLPFVALAALVYRARLVECSWRAAALSGSVLWAVVLTGLTEGLSAFRLLTFECLLGAWLAVIIIVLAEIWYRRRTPRAHEHAAVDAAVLPIATDIASVRRWWPALAGIAAIAAATGLIAVLAPPNTVDSLAYHMPRVAHWIQDRTVAHFRTHVGRQLYLPPWAEFAILQPQILAGNDRLANLVQWLAMLGCMAGVSLIARDLGGDRVSQVAAAVVSATIPMGILQASGTQNDYVVAFWLVCSVYYTLRTTRSVSSAPCVAPWRMSSSLALAFLTKATAYIYAAPFTVWLVLDRVRRGRWGDLSGTLATMALVILAVNSGYYLRNLATYGWPLGPGHEGQYVYANEAWGWRPTVSNVLRNLSLHLGMPVRRVNRIVERAIKRAHARLRLDVNDPRTTWRGTTFRVPGPNTHEDLAGNPLHLAAICISCALLVRARNAARRADLRCYAISLVAGFVLFALYLKWQPWHSRLHLPLFVLAAPLVAVMLATRRRVAAVLMTVLLVAATPWVLWSQSRPLLGPAAVTRTARSEQYFVNRRDLRDGYVAIMARIREVGCRNVGLFLADPVEYPIWTLLGSEAGTGATRIDHVAVGNESAHLPARIPDEEARPCAIVVTGSVPAEPRLLVNGAWYAADTRASNAGLFVRE